MVPRMSATPARDYLLPRLHALVDDAVADGIERDVAVAVLIDLVTGPGFNDTPLDPRQDDPPAQSDLTHIAVSEVALPSAEMANPSFTEILPHIPPR